MSTQTLTLTRWSLALLMLLGMAAADVHAQAVNVNGSFESDAVGDTPDTGIESWSFSGSTNGLASFEVVSSPVQDGARALEVAVNALGDNPWSIQAINEQIAVTPGTSYRYSVWARSDLDGATANFTVGDYDFQELGRVGSESVHLTTSWQQFTFEFTVCSDSLIRAPIHLNFAENIDDPPGPQVHPGIIHVDNLRIEPIDILPPPSNVPLATGQTKFVGNVYSCSQLPYFESYWNQVTPENAGKWGSVEATRDVMDWSDLDRAYALAKDHGMPFRFHVLVWDNQQPSWLSGLSTSEQYAEIVEWFAAVAARYADLDYVEVVNEPMNDPAFYRDALGGDGSTGWDWVINAFDLARQYFPTSKLMINEYNILSARAGDLRTYRNIIQLLQDRGLIDGIGVQGHAFSTSWQDEGVMRQNLDKLAEHGLPIQITEMDIDGATDDEQLAEYQRLFPAFYEHPAVEGITLWGWRPGMWRTAQGAYLVHTDGTERPALVWLRDYLAGTASKSGNVATAELPREYTLEAAYPNPFNPATTIRFGLPEAAHVTLTVYDALGRQAAALVDGPTPAGMHEAVFEAGSRPSGVYLYRVEARGESGRSYVRSGRVLLVK